LKRHFLFFLCCFLPVSKVFAHSFNCNIDYIAMGSSAPDLVYLKMACNASNPVQSGTNGCTAESISQDTISFTTASELGKNYYSLALAAMMAQKRVLVSAYATCPENSPSTPVVYSMRVIN